MKVDVLPCEPQYPHYFTQIKAQLHILLTAAQPSVPLHSIEHVGSTSVPDLPSKPVIDIDIIVPRPSIDAAVSALTADGTYTYRGDLGIPDRHAFHFHGGKAASEAAAANLHRVRRNVYLCPPDSQGLRNHLSVRDTCRANPRVREEYARVKLELATREWPSVEAYCEAKNQVLSWVLAQAGWSDEERGEVENVNTLDLQRVVS